MKVSLLGQDAILCDPSGAQFDDLLQRRIWALSRSLDILPWVVETAPGMNNLMVVFDAEQIAAGAVMDAARAAWASGESLTEPGRLIRAPTVYGGDGGEDLAELAARLAVSPAEVAQRHAAPTYSVAAVGAMPGFVYLSGLVPELAWPRLASPRPRAVAGSVIIGGAQTGIMPITAPTGWHIIGATSLRLFDAAAAEPALLRPGDRVRFEIVEVRG